MGLWPQLHATWTFVVMGSGSRSLRSLVRDDTDRVIARRFPIRFSNSQGRHCEEPTGRANARPMTGSATKQSIVTVALAVDCFASLAMTALQIQNTPPRSRGAIRPSFAKTVSPPLTIEGAGNAGRPMRPQPRVRNKKAHEHSHHGHTGNHPAFPAQWFYGLLRALPGDQACLTPSPARLLADLTPASGRQNHTTSPYATSAIVFGAAASTASRPALMTLRNAPLRDGTESL